MKKRGTARLGSKKRKVWEKIKKFVHPGKREPCWVNGKALGKGGERDQKNKESVRGAHEGQ